MSPTDLAALRADAAHGRTAWAPGTIHDLLDAVDAANTRTDQERARADAAEATAANWRRVATSTTD